MKTVAIIQARMSSTRLPGKVLLDIGGTTMLGRVLERVKEIRGLDDIIVAVAAEPGADKIEDEAGRFQVDTYYGHPTDVLDRYYEVARLAEADVIMRITADCPLIDPDVATQVLGLYHELALHRPPHYVSNIHPRTYPDGLDVEVFSFDMLKTAWLSASNPVYREHVTTWMADALGPDMIAPHRRRTLRYHENLKLVRWTVDTSEDLERVRMIYEKLPPRAYDMATTLKVDWEISPP